MIASIVMESAQKAELLFAGDNGSGKSTFIKLLVGLYPQSCGRILINETPIERYSKESLNRQILYVAQDEACLNETFKDYLDVIVLHPVDEKRYGEMLELLGLQDDGRAIEGNGKSLSAGQRKKFLAMKFMSRVESSSVIILDELTARLDEKAAGKVYAFIRSIAKRRDKIVILVAHGIKNDFLDITQTIVF